MVRTLMTHMPMLTIVPSRGRPAAVSELLQLMETTRDRATDVIIAVDDDDSQLDDYTRVMEHSPAWAWLEVGPRLRLLPTLNKIALKHMHDYDVLGFMGDDHRPRTFAWDASIVYAMKKAPGVVYGNDLLQGRALATAAFIHWKIVAALGYMAPPTLTHLYADNFWMDLGRATHLTYLDDVVIEHMHPTAGKSAWDAGYVEVNSKEMYAADREAYDSFCLDEWPEAINRVRNAFGIESR